MQPRALAGVALAVVAAVARPTPARACNEWNATARVVAATADGWLVVVEQSESGAGWRGSVAVVGTDGEPRVRCRRDDEAPWRCRGDRDLRVRGRGSAAAAAAYLARALDAAPVAFTTDAAPPGVAAAFCARERYYLSGDEEPCDARNTEILSIAGSPLVFARTAIGPVPFCGTSSSADLTRWMTVATLRDRLRGRIAVFDRRGATGHAEAARAALAWLDGGP